MLGALCFFVCFPDFWKVFNKPLLWPAEGETQLKVGLLSIPAQGTLILRASWTTCNFLIEYCAPVQQNWTFLFRNCLLFCTLKHESVFGQPGTNEHYIYDEQWDLMMHIMSINIQQATGEIYQVPTDVEMTVFEIFVCYPGQHQGLVGNVIICWSWESWGSSGSLWKEEGMSL